MHSLTGRSRQILMDMSAYIFPHQLNTAKTGKITLKNDGENEAMINP